MPNPYNNLTVVQSLAPAAQTSTATGTAADRYSGGAAFQDALIVVTTGTITDGTHTIEVQDSPDNSTWTAVADTYLQGSEPALDSDSSDSVFEIGYLGDQRYVRVVSTVAGASTGGVYSAAVVLANPRRGAVERS